MDCEVAAQLNGAATILSARTTSVCFQTAHDTLRQLPLVRCGDCLSCAFPCVHVVPATLFCTMQCLSHTRSTATATGSYMARVATCATPRS